MFVDPFATRTGTDPHSSLNSSLISNYAPEADTKPNETKLSMEY